MLDDMNTGADQDRERRRQVVQVTMGALGVFVILLGVYLLVLRVLETMDFATVTTLAWTALVVVLALAAAAGVGYAF